MSRFVETKVVESKEIVDTIDVTMRDFSTMSVVYSGGPDVRITIGATWVNGSSNYFSKAGVQELIKELTAIEGAMQ